MKWWPFTGKQPETALRGPEIDTALFDLRADLDALRERFTRFQNRENMRKARGVTEADDDLAEQALLALDGPKAPPVESKTDKRDLYRKLRH
jgi:hypothetical protein